MIAVSTRVAPSPQLLRGSGASKSQHTAVPVTAQAPMASATATANSQRAGDFILT